jgi:DNA-binding transcriptional ArsR family regulator
MNDALQVLAAPRRREILRLVWSRERSAGEIHRELPDVTFGAVSQHLRSLTEASLVRVRREGTFRFYMADHTAAAPFREWLEASWDHALYRLKLAAELEEARRGPRRKPKKKRKST